MGCDLSLALSTVRAAGYRVVRINSTTPSAQARKAVITAWFRPHRLDTYHTLAAKHGLTKSQVAGLIHRERLARAAITAATHPAQAPVEEE